MKASLQHQRSCPSQGHLPWLQPLFCHLHLSPQTFPPHRWGTWPYLHWTSSPQVSAEVVQGCSSWGKQGYNCCMRPLFHVEPFFPHCFFWGKFAVSDDLESPLLPPPALPDFEDFTPPLPPDVEEPPWVPASYLEKGTAALGSGSPGSTRFLCPVEPLTSSTAPREQLCSP